MKTFFVDIEAKEYRRLYTFMAIGAVVSLLFVVLFSRAITHITAWMVYDSTLSVKQTMLKENVENLIGYIDVCADEYLAEHPDASESQLEEEMTAIARRKIYSETHMDGTYMWVQRVLNYDGGDNYAIRLIHPNLSDTEGSYLSTNTVNPNGQRAYEEELKGVRENGSVYLTYDFKKLDSDEVTQKMTYSALYERFDWIVCMGVNVDDLDHYQVQAKEKMAVPQTLTLVINSSVWLILLAVMLRVYTRTRSRMFERKQRELSEKLHRDAVSGAVSRVRGQELLDEAYQRAAAGERDTLLLMLDIDFFKQFNDNYGHDLGDQVLRAFTDAVRSNTRDGDAVIRWGGDEFIAVLHGVPPEAQPALGDRIRASINGIDLPELNGERKISASMGFTYFHEDDAAVNDALTRADEAVYAAKGAGRDNWKLK